MSGSGRFYRVLRDPNQSKSGRGPRDEKEWSVWNLYSQILPRLSHGVCEGSAQTSHHDKIPCGFRCGRVSHQVWKIVFNISTESSDHDFFDNSNWINDIYMFRISQCIGNTVTKKHVSFLK